MIGHERPGIEAGSVVAGQQSGKQIKEVIAISVVEEDGSSFDPPYDEMVEGAGVVETRSTWL